MPKGYYVKQVDNLFTERINAVQAEFGLTRILWQVLNSIYDQHTAKRDALIQLMEQLADKGTIDDVLIKFRQDGIICIESENFLFLTEKGKALLSQAFGCVILFPLFAKP